MSPSTLEFDWKLRDSGFPAIDRLFRRPAFDYADRDALFSAAMREAFTYHYGHSAAFQGHADQAGFRADEIRSLADVERIPWLFVQNFKEAELLSVEKSEVLRTFTSSGTGGVKTQLFLDAASFNRLQAAAYEVYRGLGILEQKAGSCNYLMFTYDIARAPDLGTAWTDVMISKMVAAEEAVFLIRQDGPAGGGGEFRFDLELALATYERFARSGRPLRVLGFPAFMYHTFLEARKRGLPRIGSMAESWVLTGGGWKNHQGEVISKREFASFMEETAGIPRRNVRDLFGMSEHGVGYVDCEEGRLHVPVYAHAITRDPFTLKIVPDGRPGMLQLFSPLLKSYPSISLLTTDEVILRPEPCACGRPGKGLEYVGRLGLKHYEGCAIRALEYLKT